MRILRTGGAVKGSVQVTIPPSCVAILAFTCSGIYNDPLGSVEATRAFLSADLSDAVNTIETGISTGLLAIANSVFPKIPVSADERLLVLFVDACSAVIYLETVE